MPAELLRIHPDNHEMRKIRRVVEVLREGGVVVYPTDTVYGLGCDLHHRKGVHKLVTLLGIKPNKLDLSFICHDLSQAAPYLRPLATPVFKILKRTLPGPYTFLLEASHEVPKILNVSKKVVGLRIPDNRIARALARELGTPLMSASIKSDDQIKEYIPDPEEIYERFSKKVDLVIDGGPGGITPSTVVNLMYGEPDVLREGAGPTDLLY